MNGPEVTPLQTPVLSKNNLDSYFITAEECLKQFPPRLKEAFRVNDDLSTAWLMWTPPPPVLSRAPRPPAMWAVTPGARHVLPIMRHSASLHRLGLTLSLLLGKGDSGLTLQSPPLPSLRCFPAAALLALPSASQRPRRNKEGVGWGGSGQPELQGI